jgi:hypothetical protein
LLQLALSDARITLPQSALSLLISSGEIVRSDEGPSQFRRGVTQYPISVTPVVAATDADLTAIFAPLSRSNVRIGTLHHDVRQPAFVLVNELLRKHFAVLGAIGSAKSCGMSLLFSAILADCRVAHIILIAGDC